MKKILIWGTGKNAKKVLRNGINAKLLGFVETNKAMEEFEGHPVYGINEIPKGYDYIVIASIYAGEIYRECEKRNFDPDKIIFLYGVKIQAGVKDSAIIQDILGEKNYTNYCGEFAQLSGSFYEKDVELYTALNTRESFQIQEKYKWPVIEDRYGQAGVLGNYFWQDLWAAKLVHKSGVRNHFEIGSRIDGFIAHLLAMGIEVSLIDIRPFPGEVEHLHTVVDDATSLSNIDDASIESMSALCSLEHFGLGRYGDPIDPEACFKCFNEIQRVMKKGGNLYISVPVGKERVEFNAHRVFYASTIIESFQDMELKEYSCTVEGGQNIRYNVAVHQYDEDSHHGNYRYGLFHFVKK